MKQVRIGDILKRVKEAMDLEDDKEYARLTIKMNHKGIVLRDVEKGENIGTKKQFLVRENQFLLSKIDARNGAFGIVPADLDGAIITGNFWAFNVNHDEVNINWFNLFTSSLQFLYICDVASTGTTNRKYLDEGKFIDYEVMLPDKELQDEIVAKYVKINEKLGLIQYEIDTQQQLLDEMKKNTLESAVKGQLLGMKSLA